MEKTSLVKGHFCGDILDVQSQIDAPVRADLITGGVQKRADGMGGQGKLLCDLLIGQAEGGKPCHFPLPNGERFLH